MFATSSPLALSNTDIVLDPRQRIPVTCCTPYILASRNFVHGIDRLLHLLSLLFILAKDTHITSGPYTRSARHTSEFVSCDFSLSCIYGHVSYWQLPPLLNSSSSRNMTTSCNPRSILPSRSPTTLPTRPLARPHSPLRSSTVATSDCHLILWRRSSKVTVSTPFSGSSRLVQIHRRLL